MAISEQHYFKLLFFQLPIGKKDGTVKSGISCIVGCGGGLCVKQIATPCRSSEDNEEKGFNGEKEKQAVRIVGEKEGENKHLHLSCLGRE